MKSVDAQVIVSALMLENILRFCLEKYKTQCYAFMTSEDICVHQPSFVGLVLCYQTGNKLLKRDAEIYR